jgi:hypothetical protein
LELSWNLRAHGLQIQAERNKPLLGPVVEVSLDPSLRFVACGDDSCAGSDQLGAGGRVRDRRRAELSEARHAQLGAAR